MVISGYREKMAAKSMSQAPREGGAVDGALVDDELGEDFLLNFKSEFHL